MSLLSNLGLASLLSAAKFLGAGSQISAAPGRFSFQHRRTNSSMLFNDLEHRVAVIVKQMQQLQPTIGPRHLEIDTRQGSRRRSRPQKMGNHQTCGWAEPGTLGSEHSYAERPRTMIYDAQACPLHSKDPIC